MTGPRKCIVGELMGADLFGAENFFARERERIKREFYDAHLGKRKSSRRYADALKKRFEMKRKAK